MLNYKRFTNEELVKEFKVCVLFIASETHSLLQFRFGGISPDHVNELVNNLRMHEKELVLIKVELIKRGLSVTY